MHTSLEITVDPDVTDALLGELGGVEGVITLSARKGESIKPPGDVISVTVLNRDADTVVRITEERTASGHVTIQSATVDSLVDVDENERIRGDVDEVLWADAETAMRRHTRPTLNFFVVTAVGTLAGVCGLLSADKVTTATALVAAAIIVPAFEPLARLSLAVTLRRPVLLAGAVGSLLLTYGTAAVVAVASLAVVRATAAGYYHHFLTSPVVHDVQYLPGPGIVLSAAGAVAGVVMVASGRFTALPGAVVALQLVPATIVFGFGVEAGHWGEALRGLDRLGIDAGMVVAAGLVYFAYKQVAVHQGRRTLH